MLTPTASHAVYCSKCRWLGEDKLAHHCTHPAARRIVDTPEGPVVRYAATTERNATNQCADYQEVSRLDAILADEDRRAVLFYGLVFILGVLSLVGIWLWK